MPRHDFHCEGCGHVLTDVYRTFAEAEMQEVCPECTAGMTQLFVPTRDIVISRAFREHVRWEDIHDESPAELARMDHVAPLSEARSTMHKADKKEAIMDNFKESYAEALVKEERRFA